MKIFAERLKELRTERNLSQRQIAKAIGVSQNAITQWENENRIPGANIIILLAKYFDVSADYLLGLKDV